MKSQWISYLLPVTAGCTGIVLCVVILYGGSQRNSIAVPASSAPQCAHWSIFRTAQLLGIPTAPGEIQRLLPNQSKGHTMAQVVETLEKVGIKAEGFRHDWNSLTQQTFPCIVHLAKPDHYVVVSGIEPERGYIHIFDDAGNRTRWRRETFAQRWTGYTLHVQKDLDFFVVRAGDSKPHIVFDHLILDKGDIPAVGEPVEFAFPIHNFGKSDLVVEDVKVNCGCLASEKPDYPIKPGESGIVKLFYSIEPKRGVFSETAAVRTNDPDFPVVVLTACGFTGVEVRIEPSRIILDRLFIGQKTVYRCFVRYTGEWSDFHVGLESTDLTGVRLLRHECLPIDQANLPGLLLRGQPNAKIPDSVAKNNQVLELTFEPTGNLSENISGTIVLHTNVMNYERFTLHVTGVIKSPVQAFPSVIALNDDKEHSVVLVSLVDVPFEIVAIDCDPAIAYHYNDAMQKEHRLRIRKNDILETTTLIVRVRLDKEQTITDIPLTIFLNDTL